MTDTAEPVEHTDSCYLISSKKLQGPVNCETFEPQNWTTLKDTVGGRASVWATTLQGDTAVLKHYYRGGMVAKILDDQFIWTGLSRCRSIAEYRLLKHMITLDLPVPEPLGARVVRSGATGFGVYYTCDLITRRIIEADNLAYRLGNNEAPLPLCRKIGETVKSFHQQGIFHADLNLTNIMIDQYETVYLLDFDRGRLRSGDHWKKQNISRLQRSLDKLACNNKENYNKQWDALVDGYQR